MENNFVLLDDNNQLMQPSFSPGINEVDLLSAFNSVANNPKILVTEKEKSDSQTFKTPQHKL